MTLLEGGGKPAQKLNKQKESQWWVHTVSSQCAYEKSQVRVENAAS